MTLTKEDMDVIICMLDDIDMMCGLKPEELELREKLERWIAEND
jgi:hypothetical protein